MKPIGQLCLNCGSSWSDERLAHEKRFKPNLISCCPDRKMVDVYTHPAELTDEEILDMSDSFCLDDGVSTLYEFTASGLIDFARAILRKAQEK